MNERRFTISSLSSAQIPVQRMDYDQESDVVYIAFLDQHNSYGDDISTNVVLRRDWDDEHITGVTILNFMRLLQSESPELLNLPFHIDFQQ